MQRSRWSDGLLSLAVGLGALAVYLPAVARGPLEADAGEFQFVPYLAGIAHPTGYPLYNLLGWAWSHLLTLGSVAYRMNLLSAAFAALAVGLTCRLVLALVPRAPLWQAWPGAAVVALAFALTPTFWSHALMAEVYALQAAILAALLFATLVLGSHPDRWWAIGLVAGLGLAHHSTTVLYLPGVVGALLLMRRRPSPNRQIVLAMIALLAPLLLYAYIPLRAPHTPYLAQRIGPSQTLVLYHNTLDGFVDFVAGQPFSAALALRGLGGRALAAGRRLVSEVGPFALVLAAAGAFGLWRRSRAAATLLLSGLVLQVTFNLAYDIGDVHVLYIPIYLMLAVLAGVLMLSIDPSSRRQAWLSPGLALVTAFSLLLRLPQARERALASVPVPPPERWSRLLADTPADAILVSNDRNEIMPLWYYQYVERRRPDLTGLFPLIVPEPEYADVGGVLGQALKTGRDVYLIKQMPGLEVGFQLSGEQPPVRVMGEWQTQPKTLMDAPLGGSLRLLGYDLSPETAQVGQTVSVVLYWQPLTPVAAPYSSYVHVLRADGSVPWPGSDHRPGGAIYPANLWRLGQVIRDEHVLAVPADAPPGTYRLIAGMYAYPSLQALGETIELGRFAVVSAR